MDDNKKLNATDVFLGLLICAAIVIVPLFCRLIEVQCNSDEINVIRAEFTKNDIFCYGKSILLKVIGVIMAISIGFELLSGDGMRIRFKSVPVIMSGLFTVLALLSCVFSSYRSVAFNGVTERYEGFWVWLVYMLLFVVTMSYAVNINKSKLVTYGLGICGLALGAIGMLQAFNVNIFDYTVVQKLVMGKNYKPDSMKFAFDSVFATLYNPNSASMFFGMMFSFSAMCALFMPLKEKLKYIMAAVAVMSIFAVIGSDSVGGVMGMCIGVAVSSVVALLYYIIVRKNRTASILGCSLVVVVILAIVLVFTSDLMVAQKARVIMDTVKGNTEQSYSGAFYTDINVEGERGDIVTHSGVFSIDYADEATQFMHDGVVLEPISTEPMEGNDSGILYVYEECNVKWNMYIYDSPVTGNKLVSVIAEDVQGNSTYFLFGEVDGALSFLDKFNNPVDITTEAEKVGFEGMERLGSNRGYIWSRSIPLLKNNILIGSGCDTFALVFPQWDVRNKLIYLGNPYIIIDKPHNMYLQLGINTGVVSLVVMLALFVLYVVQTVKRIFSGGNQLITALRLGTLAGAVAYLVTGFTCDSMVGVAPVFWVLLGLGFGINTISEGRNNEQID